MKTIQNLEDIRNLGTILGIWAHPDDETYSMGGIMAAAVQNGQKVVCVTATRGEAGVQDESRWPAIHLRDIRTQELQAAFTALGVSEHHWLDYPDGGCDKTDVGDAVKQIIDYINIIQPDSILTFGPDGITGHPDHIAVSQWTSQAVDEAGSKAIIYHAIQTQEQYVQMLEADKVLNIFFNIEKPPTCDACDCAICFKMDDSLYGKKLAALKAMPSQTEAMLQKFNHVLRSSIGIEAFTERRA